jgi:2-amino-4-hydroxy-6-hydroxymethyldihydropteridine diphosphokinase
MPTSVTAYIALGANLGDRARNIKSALTKLGATPHVEVMRISSLIETPAVGGPPDSPPFLNAAAEIRTTLSPQTLLARLLEIEQELGRTRRVKWGPRLIDLDLILFGDQIIAEPNLQIPHPLMHERRFVLTPLDEIAPNIEHPILKTTIRQLLQRLPQ